ncbi:MAG: DUF63 family protein [Candidatus Norongarragalinales archaeon]
MRYPGEYAPYNAVNTLVFAAAALVAAYLIYKLLKFWRVEVNAKFVLAVTPFVLFGSALRVCEDAKILPRETSFFGVPLFLFITPGIYFLVFGVVVASVWLGGVLESAKKISREKFMAVVGITLFLLAFSVTLPLQKYWLHAAAIIGLGALGVAFLEVISRALKHESELIERLAVFSQCLDGGATFVATAFGTPSANYFEQHVVGGAVIGAGGPLAFLALKTVFALAVVLVVRSELRKPSETRVRNYLLLLVTIFGLAPGARDLLRLSAGV